MKKVLFSILLTALIFSTWGIGHALTLSDVNSVATINAGGGTDRIGMNSWNVDGVSQLYQQWFWFRTGDTGGESSIDAISAPTVVQPTNNIAVISYENTQIKVAITYILTGGAAGSKWGDIAETINITNKGRTALDLHFFQYSDFDLNGNLNPAIRHIYLE